KPRAIFYIKNPSDAVQLTAVRRDGWAIQYFENPSEAVQLAGVRQDWCAIQCIKNPTEAVQLAAVRQNGLAIKFLENPSDAVLAAVNFEGVDLTNHNLAGLHLQGVNLTGTCLDPENKPNGDVEGFEVDPTDSSRVIGYRTRKSLFNGDLEMVDGETYTAPVFSTAETECHPGLYLYPTAHTVDAFCKEHNVRHYEIIRVTTRSCDVHRAGSKWRTKELQVVGEGKRRRK
ncbi:MAG: hypothetical protein DRN81_03830, partial [Thermoproteota archaeon]